MIYLENDFYSNFNSMVNANDEMAIKEMFIDQISSVVAFNKAGLLDLFKKVGITTSENPTNKELTILIINNIKSNKKLQIGLAYLIAERNNLLQDEIKKQRDDSFSGNDGKKEKPKRDLKQTADVVSSLANSIQVVANTINNTNAGKIQENLENQTNSKSPEEIQLEQQQQAQKESEAKAKKKRRRNTIIGVIVVVAIVGGIVAYKKGLFRKKASV
jgi:hypothetical protein